MGTNEQIVPDDEFFTRWPRATIEVLSTMHFDMSDVSDIAFYEDVPLGAAYQMLTEGLVLATVVCMACAEEVGERGECPGSSRECGHHCDCLWHQDVCCWCPAHINDDGEVVPG